jgi:hypothetical protein
MDIAKYIFTMTLSYSGFLLHFYGKLEFDLSSAFCLAPQVLNISALSRLRTYLIQRNDVLLQISYMDTSLGAKSHLICT